MRVARRGASRCPHLKEASHALVGALQPGDSASFLSFSHKIELHTAAERDPDSMDRALESVTAGGRTALVDALYAALLVPEESSRSLIILFSDGGENASWLSRELLFDALKRANAVVYTVAEHNESVPFGADLLQRIADASGGTLLRAEADRRLAGVFVGILREFRLRYLLTYTPTGVRRGDGWHRLAVKLMGRSGRVIARPGYFSRPDSR